MDGFGPNRIEIQQALHGYASGHRQLQSSTKLPLPAERTLVILSDLSGPTLYPGFDTYVTGYRLPDTDYFALARTWYASEMERPGCVWTQTLLIRHSDLNRLIDLRALLQLFRRPNTSGALTDYGVPITVSHSDVISPPRIDSRQALSVVSCLYEYPDRPIFVPADSAADTDDLFLAVWSQQWPTLRQQFAFCTGALANRALGGKPFDLQAVPDRMVRQIRREVPLAIVAGEEGQPSLAVSARWREVATDDLDAGSTTAFREFLAAFAPPGSGREMFAPLAEAQSLLCGLGGTDADFGRILVELSRRFPRPQDGERVKRMVIGIAPEQALWRANIPEMNVLRILATTDVGPSFDAADLRVSERAARLWHDKPANAINLLTSLPNAPLNNLGEAILRGLIDSIGQSELELIGREAARRLPMLITVRPDLASLPAAWRVSADQQREIADAVASARSGAIGKEVVYAALAANADAAAGRLAQQVGSEFVPAVLEWVDSHADRPRSAERGDQWSSLLAADPGAVLSWLSRAKSLTFPTLALASRVLDPHSAAVRNWGAESWLRLARIASGRLSWPAEVAFRSFCMAIALEHSGKHSDELAAASFEILHTAAAKDQIAYEDWNSFQGALPTLFWWQNWDRCERLRRGLIAAFVRFDWPPATILQCTSDRDTFSALLASARAVRDGEAFCRRLIQVVRADRISVPESIAAILGLRNQSP